MHGADYAVARCLSVRLFVRLSHAGILSKQLYISSNFFYQPGSHTIPIFLYQTVWQYSAGNPPPNGCRTQAVMKKLRFSANISLYIGYETRQSYSYNGR